jgi:hypothetical protein
MSRPGCRRSRSSRSPPTGSRPRCPHRACVPDSWTIAAGSDHLARDQ